MRNSFNLTGESAKGRRTMRICGRARKMSGTSLQMVSAAHRSLPVDDGKPISLLHTSLLDQNNSFIHMPPSRPPPAGPRKGPPEGPDAEAPRLMRAFSFPVPTPLRSDTRPQISENCRGNIWEQAAAGPKGAKCSLRLRHTVFVPSAAFWRFAGYFSCGMIFPGTHGLLSGVRIYVIRFLLRLCPERFVSSFGQSRQNISDSLPSSPPIFVLILAEYCVCICFGVSPCVSTLNNISRTHLKKMKPCVVRRRQRKACSKARGMHGIFLMLRSQPKKLRTSAWNRKRIPGRNAKTFSSTVRPCRKKVCFFACCGIRMRLVLSCGMRHKENSPHRWEVLYQ